MNLNELEEKNKEKLKRIPSNAEIEAVTIARKITDELNPSAFGDVYKSVISKILKDGN